MAVVFTSRIEYIMKSAPVALRSSNSMVRVAPRTVPMARTVMLVAGSRPAMRRTATVNVPTGHGDVVQIGEPGSGNAMLASG